MNLDIAGRRALILGGGKGLGRAIAIALAAESVHPILAGRNQAALTATAAEIEATTGIPALTRYVDLGKPETVEALGRSSGDIDILVLNGGGPPAGPVTAVTDEQWRQYFESMVLSPIQLTNIVLPGMRARRFGRIVIVLSSGVTQPIPNLGLSNSLRLALVGWAKTLAGEIASDGVTVNGLAPGRIHTGRVDELDAAAANRSDRSLEEIRQTSRASIPMNRYGDTAEFAAAATFLASRQASYITGSVMRVDGGMIRSI